MGRQAASPSFDSGGAEYDGIVFDVSGTLLRPQPSPTEVYRQIAADFGHALEPQLVQQRFRAAFLHHFGSGRLPGSPEVYSRAPTDETSERDRWRRVVCDTLAELSAADREAAFGRLWDHFRHAAHWDWVDGAFALVTRLQRAGIRLAVATNFDSRVRAILDGHPPLDRVGDRFLSSEIGFSKPDPRFFKAVASRLGARPARLLMIGDDPINDLAGSRAAGWQAMGIDEALTLFDASC